MGLLNILLLPITLPIGILAETARTVSTPNIVNKTPLFIYWNEATKAQKVAIITYYTIAAVAIGAIFYLYYLALKNL